MERPLILKRGKFWIRFGTNTLTPGEKKIMLISFCELKINHREKYDKFIEVKRKFDPDYVFTANGLGVDATNAAFKKCVKITTK